MDFDACLLFSSPYFTSHPSYNQFDDFMNYLLLLWKPKILALHQWSKSLIFRQIFRWSLMVLFSRFGLLFLNGNP